MGNSQSDSGHQMLENYQRIDCFEDSRFGTITIAKSMENGQLVWIKEAGLVLEAKIELEQYMDTIKGDKEYFRIFSTLDFAMINAQSTLGYCAHELWKCTAMLQYYEKSLELEIDQRFLLHPKQYFPEDEIWLMFDAIQEMEIHYRSMNRFHSDLRLGNIFIAEDGSIKFLDVFLINWRLNSFMKHIIDGSKAPLSPEKMAHIHIDKPNEEWISDDEVWSIGIILLCMATLKKDSSDFYNWKGYTIIRKAIDQALDETRLRYSPRLHNLLVRCLSQPKDRFSMGELINMVGSSYSIRGTIN